VLLEIFEISVSNVETTFFFSLFFVAIFSSLLYTNVFFLIALNLYMFFVILNVNVVETN